MLKLMIYEPEEALREIELQAQIYTLGKDAEENDIVFSDENVSQYHAKICFENEQFIIEDLNSTNGVYVNYTKIQKKTPIKHGDIIRLGLNKIEVKDTNDKKDQQVQPTKILTAEELQAIFKEDQIASQKKDDETLTIETNRSESPQTISQDDKTRKLASQPGAFKEADKTRKLKEPPQKAPVQEDQKTRKLNVSRKAIPETVRIDPKTQKSISSRHKLLVISQKQSGKKYILDKKETIIGRSKDCHIRINEKTVSSHHAIFLVEEDICRLRDLDSKNGVYVNGSRIHKEHILNQGDEIEIDPVKFKFFHRDSIFMKESLPQKSKKNFVLATVASVLILTAMGTYMIFSTGKPNTKPPLIYPVKSTERHIPAQLSGPQKNTANKTADMHLCTANEFFKNFLWNDAVIMYKKVLKYDPNYFEASIYIQKSRRELGNYNLLEQGLSSILNREYLQGIQKLEQIPLDSVYYKTAKTEIENARDEMTRGVKRTKSEMLIEDALNHYSEGNSSIALVKLQAVPHFRAKSLLKTEAARLIEKIKTIEALSEQGMNEYKNRRSDRAFEIWGEVLSLDNDIIGRTSSVFSNRIFIYMAEELYQQAKAAYERKDYSVAIQNCSRALKAMPGHKGALEIEHLLTEKGKKLCNE